jgi:hypothetical protein
MPQLGNAKEKGKLWSNFIIKIENLHDQKPLMVVNRPEGCHMEK